ncbi:hypothetical protein F5B20DRAFT_366223 [Whalleya microplaca]|nr:hypothetical protein F5B20DRAFT_366223 [Whalleya microplaca]
MATPGQIEDGYPMTPIHQQSGSRPQSPNIPTPHTIRSRTTDSPPHQGFPVEPHDLSSEESLGHSNFRKDSDIKNKAPKGWPSIAASQMYYSNFSIHRRFRYLMQRILVDEETKLAYLETKLEELDKEDEQNDISKLKSLPFDPDRLLTPSTRTRTLKNPPNLTPAGNREKRNQEEEEYSQWKDKDLLLEATTPRLKNYIELLLLDKEMQRQPPISRREHKAFYDEIRQYHVLEGSAYQFLHPRDDFVTTVTDRMHQYFETMVYGDKSSCFKRLIGRKHSSHLNNHGKDDAPVIEINNWIFVVIIKVLVAFASGVLLLSPIAILFLVDLSREASFGVIVAFLFAFVAVMISLNTNTYTVLVGLSAYMAVLVTFLSNLEQGRH